MRSELTVNQINLFTCTYCWFTAAERTLCFILKKIHIPSNLTWLPLNWETAPVKGWHCCYLDGRTSSALIAWTHSTLLYSTSHSHPLLFVIRLILNQIHKICAAPSSQASYCHLNTECRWLSHNGLFLLLNYWRKWFAWAGNKALVWTQTPRY